MRDEKGQTFLPIPLQVKVPIGVTLVFFGLFLLNKNNNWGIVSIIIGIILIVG